MLSLSNRFAASSPTGRKWITQSTGAAILFRVNAWGVMNIERLKANKKAIGTIDLYENRAEFLGDIREMITYIESLKYLEEVDGRSFYMMNVPTLCNEYLSTAFLQTSVWLVREQENYISEVVNLLLEIKDQHGIEDKSLVEHEAYDLNWCDVEFLNCMIRHRLLCKYHADTIEKFGQSGVYGVLSLVLLYQANILQSNGFHELASQYFASASEASAISEYFSYLNHPHTQKTYHRAWDKRKRSAAGKKGAENLTTTKFRKEIFEQQYKEWKDGGLSYSTKTEFFYNMNKIFMEFAKGRNERRNPISDTTFHKWIKEIDHD